MTVTSVGSSSTISATAQAELDRAQQQLAADLANKAADKVIANDKVAVTRSQRDLAQQGTQGQVVDLDL